MNTTTKCQHAAVFITLSILLIILACVAFLAPVTTFHGHRNDVIEPVTQVVTNPTRFGDFWDETTSKYDRRHSTRSTRSTRHSTSRHGKHSTDRPGDHERQYDKDDEPAGLPIVAGGAVAAGAGAGFAAGYDHDYDDDGSDRRVGHDRKHDKDDDDDERDSRRSDSRTTRSRGRTTKHPGDQQATRTTRSSRHSRTTTESSRHSHKDGNRDSGDDLERHEEAPPTAVIHSHGGRRDKRSTHESDGHDDHDHKKSSHDHDDDKKHGQDDKKRGQDDKKKDHKSDDHDKSHGYVSVKRNESNPQQMIMQGQFKDLTPDQVYAIMLHQHGDTQNGCENLGPAFNEGSFSMESGRHKRSIISNFIEHKKHSESKDHEKHKEHPENDKREHDDEKAHEKRNPNGALMGFMKTDEEGEGKFEFPIPKHHQEACKSCGHGVMGRGVSTQAVKGIPKEQKKAAQEIVDKVKVYVEKFNTRKKRSLKPSSSLSSTSDELTLGDEYHHRMNPVTPEEMAESRELYENLGVMEMNRMAHNNTLNGTAMAGYMDEPTACGVFARMNPQ